MLREFFAPALIVTIIAMAAFGFAACSDDESTSPTETSGGPTPGSLPTPVFRGGDQEPKERITRGDRLSPGTLGSATTTDFGSYSSVSFFFIEVVPDFNVQYVDEPIACGSGEPLDIEGTTFLQVRFTPSRAHNEDGDTTYSLPDDFGASLPAIVEIQQSCDFEGELTFVFGLDEQADFKVGYLTAPLTRVETIVIDIENP